MEAHFKIRDKDSKTSYIQLYFNFNATRIRFATPYTIRTNDWGKGYPKQIAGTKNIRHQLSHLKLKLDGFIKDTINKSNRLPSKIELTEQIKLVTGQTSAATFASLLSEYLNGKQVKASTLTQVKVAFDALTAFAPRLELIDINRKFAAKYTQHLINSGLMNSTINRHHKCIKAFTAWLYLNDHTPTNVGKYFVNQTAKPKAIIALTDAEVNTLQAADLSGKLDRVRCLYYFSCLTGLRFEDLKQVSKEKIADGMLTIRQQKTGAIIAIPLLPEALNILTKYNYQLPVISNQKANEYTKELFKALKLNRPVLVTKNTGSKIVDKYTPLSEAVTFHTSRKTFVTLALSKGMPAKIVQALSGHKSDQVFNRYIDFSKELLKAEMQKLQRTTSADNILKVV